MKLCDLFELKTPKNGMRDATPDELRKAENAARKLGLAFGSARVNDSTGDVWIAAHDKMNRIQTIVIAISGSNMNKPS